MATLAALAPITGILAGIIVAHLAKKEIKPGQKYFQLLQNALIAIIAIVWLWEIKIIAITAGIIIFLVLYITNFKHPIGLTTLLAIPAITAPATQIPIFLYYIPTGTLNTKSKNVVAVIIYALIILIYHLFF